MRWNSGCAAGAPERAQSLAARSSAALACPKKSFARLLVLPRGVARWLACMPAP